MVSIRPRWLVWLTAAVISISVFASRADAQLLGAFNEEEEIELGRRAADEMERDLRLLDDEEVTTYISELGQRLAERSQRSQITYQFKVVDTA